MLRQATTRHERPQSLSRVPKGTHTVSGTRSARPPPLPPPRRLNRPARTVPVRAGRTLSWFMKALRRLLGQPTAQKELPDARVGEDRQRGVGDAGAAKLQHDAVIGNFQRAP